MTTVLLLALGIQARQSAVEDLDLPARARTMILVPPITGLNIRDMSKTEFQTVTPKDGLMLRAGYFLSVDKGNYSDMRLDSVGYARLNSSRTLDGASVNKDRGMAYITHLDPPARDWYRRRRDKDKWYLEVSVRQGKLMTRRHHHQLNSDLRSMPELRVNGFGTSTISKGTAWSCTQDEGKVLDRTDDTFRILVGRGGVLVGGYSPLAPLPDRTDRDSVWDYFVRQSKEVPLTLQSPFERDGYRPIEVGALQWLLVLGDPLTGPFKVIGPEPIDQSDWPEIVEMLSMGVVRIPTIYLPPRLATGFQSEGVQVNQIGLSAFFAPGETIRPQFERFAFRDPFTALRGLDVPTPPTAPFAIRGIIEHNQKRAVDYLSQFQIAAQLELAYAEYKNESNDSDEPRRRFRQTAKVVVNLVIEDTFGAVNVLKTVEVSPKPSFSRTAVSAQQSLSNRDGVLYRAVYQAVAQAFWEVTDESVPLRWRGVIKDWSGNSSSGSGTIDVPKSTGLHEGQRLQVFRQAGSDPKSLTVAGTVEVQDVFDNSVKIKPIGKAVLDRFRAGDLVEEEVMGR
ncbi:MAG TPA: hypothetical protein PLL78_05775 [Fimbriimonadaceae bacterium]|nr:hypothetical protein [Fimbriimonadaceae bacterium]HRJ96176.1 hypothetical protein [Fimbriimonadaceae bacterium]